jgi:hypothetical protein
MPQRCVTEIIFFNDDSEETNDFEVICIFGEVHLKSSGQISAYIDR